MRLTRRRERHDASYRTAGGAEVHADRHTHDGGVDLWCTGCEWSVNIPDEMRRGEDGHPFVYAAEFSAEPVANTHAAGCHRLP